MDVIQDWASFLAHTITPTYLAPFTSRLAPLQTHLRALVSKASEGPDLASIALLLIILLVSMKILGMLFRAVMWWVRLAVRLLFWGALILGGFWVWNRGVDGAIEDVGHAVGVWIGEWEYWKKEAERARVEREILGGKRRNKWW